MLQSQFTSQLSNRLRTRRYNASKKRKLAEKEGGADIEGVSNRKIDKLEALSVVNNMSVEESGQITEDAFQTMKDELKKAGPKGMDSHFKKLLEESYEKR